MSSVSLSLNELKQMKAVVTKVAGNAVADGTPTAENLNIPASGLAGDIPESKLSTELQNKLASLEARIAALEG